MDLTVIHYLILLLLSSIFVVPDDTAAGSDCSVQCDVTCNPQGAINCTLCTPNSDGLNCHVNVACGGSCLATGTRSPCDAEWNKCLKELLKECQNGNLVNECIIHNDSDEEDESQEDNTSTLSQSVEVSTMTHVDFNYHLFVKISLVAGIQVCQTSVDMICGSTTTTSTEMSADSPSPEPMTTLSTSGSDPESSTSPECSTSSTPTETSTTSSPTPDPTSTALTDSTTTETIWTSSGSTPSSESSASGVTSSQASAADDSTVEVAVLSCLAVLFVVVVVVAVFFWWRRKRQADGVSKENNPSCLSVETNLHHKQDSFNIYDKLCHDNRRTNIGNASTTAANSRDNDNNDDYAYIDDPAINKGVVRLHEVTTDGQHALTDPCVSGLESDLSSTYTLARPIDNDIPDPQPPDYFILEERDKKGCGEPAQYFILEEKGEKNSAADTDTQQYFILEDKPEGEGGESASKHMSSRSEVDYFVLEKDDGQELDCADVARSDASRAPPEEAEYSRLDPNSCQESDYTSLSRPQQPPDARGDNPYCLASHPE